MEKKLTLFFVHGNSSSSKVYDSIVKDETILGNKVVVDLPGYGDNNLEKYTEKDFSIKKYREFLLQEIGKIDGEIILFGNSLGGHLVIEIAS